MKFFGLELTVKRAPTGATPVGGSGSGGWWPVIREPHGGAWQQNKEWRAADMLANSTIYACISRIAQDVGKLRVKLLQVDAHGIEREITSPAFSPVLRKPNRYQTAIQFREFWITSKLSTGNTIALKQRDARGVVVALYVLDWKAVTPLIAPDGSVYYELRKNELAGLPSDEAVVVPASEVIHDRMNCLYHPLIGVPPIFASGNAAAMALSIIKDGARFAESGSMPGGFLTTPQRISDEVATRLKEHFDANYSGANRGKVAVLGDGLSFVPARMSAVDSEIIEQLKLSAETICSTFHVPPWKIGIGDPPTYNGAESVSLKYYEDCLQPHLEAMEACLDEGLGLVDAGYLCELDLDGLIRMDTVAMVESLAKATGAGIMKPNEARGKMGLGPVEGGDTPYLQQQNFALSALARRDEQAAPSASPQSPSDQGDKQRLFDALLINKRLEDYAHA